MLRVRHGVSSRNTVERVRTGPTDPGDSRSGDYQIVKTYKVLGEEGSVKTDGTKEVFSVFDPDQKYQHILIFLSDLPPSQDGEGGFQVAVTKVEVYGS